MSSIKQYIKPDKEVSNVDQMRSRNKKQDYIKRDPINVSLSSHVLISTYNRKI